MKSEDAIRARIEALEEKYDANDPPTTPVEDEMEVELLRAIAELEWAIDERDEPPYFTR